MTIIIPRNWKLGAFDEAVFTAQDVVAGDPLIVSANTYSVDFVKAAAQGSLWVEYTPANPGNTLTVGLLLAPRGGATFLPPVDAGTTVLTASGVVPICLLGCPDFQITLESAGAGTDVVTAVFCGKTAGGCC